MVVFFHWKPCWLCENCPSFLQSLLNELIQWVSGKRQTWEWKYFFPTTEKDFFTLSFSCRHPGYFAQQERASTLLLQLENGSPWWHFACAKPFHKLPRVEETVHIVDSCLTFPHALMEKALLFRRNALKINDYLVIQLFFYMHVQVLSNGMDFCL